MSERAVAVKKSEATRESSAINNRKPDHSHPSSSPADRILYLQRTIGNQAVQRLIESEALQPKLRISQQGDQYEQEAKRVANAVTHNSDIQIQQQCATCKNDVHRQPEEEEELLQTKATGSTAYAGSDIQDQLLQSKGNGRSLPQSSRAGMESRFGTDFGDVRIHTDNQAAEMARTVNAQAFTTGRDVYFGPGKYNPGTTSGDKLLAHELTHVVQQRSSAPQGLSDSLSKSNTNNSDTIYRQSAPLAKTEDVAHGVMELKNEPDFIPKGPIADYFADKKTGKVNVRFGNMAEGIISVKKSKENYRILKNQSIPFTTPIFPGTKFKPRLKLSTKKGKIKGYVGIGKGGKDRILASYLRKDPSIFGLAGFDLGKNPEFTNTLEGGNLHLGITGDPIKLGGAFTGKLSLEAVNGQIKTFEGNAKINIPKLAPGEMELSRSKEGDITGKATVDTQIKNVTGTFVIIWEKGGISGEGKVGYKGEKLSGEVTLKIMEKSQAEQLEREKNPPEGPAKSQRGRKARKTNYVVFGEGDLTFSFTEWLAGNANVIIDHKGFLTIIGKIVPEKEIELFPQKDYNKKLFKVEARASYGIPVVGNIFIFANVGMDAFANIGPGKLYNISVEGTYSTDPKKAQSFAIQGNLNISAGAGLRLRGEAGAGWEIIAHDIKAGAGINGIAAIRGYAEATPIIGYREKGKEGEDKKGEFFIRGELEIAAQPFLGLSGDLFVELDSPWWSPAPDKRWTWPLVNKEWPVGGSMGLNASVDYVFGSNEPPALEFKPVGFSGAKFMTDLYSNKAKAKSGGGKDQKGKWQDKNTKTAEPPKAGKKGGAQIGKAPELPPAKSKVKPGGARKARKPVNPNARTAEGKKIKEYQEEAAKKGKKPEGKGPIKGAGKEESAAKDTGEKAHDEQLKKGLAALEAVTKGYAEKGATKDELKVAVKAVRRKFKVFKSISIVDGVKTWDFKYVASDGNQGGPPKAGVTPNAKEAKKTKVGDYISYSSEKMILLVTEVNVHTEHGDMVRARAGKADKRKTSFLLPYNRYGKVWKILAIKRPIAIKRQTYKSFIAFGGPGEGGQVIIGNDNLNKSATSTYASDEDKADMGLTGKHKHLGHLVANVFTGPGTYKSGNIVAMTQAANLTKQGMRGIEGPIQKDIENFAVYKYSARPKDTATPPNQIEVIAIRLFPSTSHPPGVPNKKIVDNK